MSKHNNKRSIDNTINEENTSPVFDSQDEQENSRRDNIDENRGSSKRLKAFGLFCIVGFIAALIFTNTPTVNTSSTAEAALETGVSTTLQAGTVLLSKDKSISQEDYTIVHEQKSEKTKIWVWDYAAEDGDYVQILVDGSPITEAFMIKNKPRELTIPTSGDIQIKGIRDGGGGLTYAVRYELNGTTYFNTAPEGKYNTYTLIRE